MAKEAPRHGRILICRADQLPAAVEKFHPAAVLSIEHPGVAPQETGAAPRLSDGTPQMILAFWDIEATIAGGPDIAQVEKGLAFVMDHIREGDVVIHCSAGISRSTALALGVLSILKPYKNEDELIELLLKIRPIAAPNIVVVDMVDRLTGRQGKLAAAARRNATITAARENANELRREWCAKHPDTGASAAYRKQHPEKFPKPPKP